MSGYGQQPQHGQQHQQYYPPPSGAPPQQGYYAQPPPQQYASPLYAQPSSIYAPPQYATDPLLNAPRPGKVAENYNPRPKYNDVWATILFFVHLAGFVALSYFSIKTFILHNTTPAANGGVQSQFTLDGKAIALLAVCVVIGFALSIIYLLIMQRWPRAMIMISWIFSIVLYFVAAAFYAYLGSYIAAIIFVIFGIFYALAWFWWKSRIPFAVIMLETVTSVTRKYPGTVMVGIVGLIVQVAYSIWWVITVVGAFQLFDSNSASCRTTTQQTGGSTITTTQCTNYPLYGIMLFLIFSFYWTSQVIKTVGHVTVSGVFASFYFLDGTPAAPTSPTFSALGRALTTSFGSICFGSLIIALLQTLKAVLRNFANDSSNGFAAFLAICAVCFLNCIEGLVEYFNHYAYTEVAIYGKPFCAAAKDTWNLIKDRGIEAIINDNLVG
ncbi:plasma-membrane choline transporter-domain-containing protein, partial [Endogone sp. FLAS-F59071]